MLQQDEPDDYVVATGETHSVQRARRDRVRPRRARLARARRHDPAFLRPAEVDLLIGDAAKARRCSAGKPQVDFNGLVGMMVDADIERAARPPARRPRRARPLTRTACQPLIVHPWIR